MEYILEMFQRKPIGLIGIAFGWLGFLVIIFCFVLYVTNKKQYISLLKSYNSSTPTLPQPYKLYSEMGFLGSFGMSYFFSRLINGKSVFFYTNSISKNNESLNEETKKNAKWISLYFKLSMLLVFSLVAFYLLCIIQIYFY